ncbi:MAG: glycosyltransferase, partial [Pseudorhodobacter sp.]|nr:glycosyltransferase [Frankiaceae bacterium]
MMAKPLLSIVSPCYNEQENVEELYRRVRAAVAPLDERYDFEYIFIDNHSNDDTPQRLRNLEEIAADIFALEVETDGLLHDILQT